MMGCPLWVISGQTASPTNVHFTPESGHSGRRAMSALCQEGHCTSRRLLTVLCKLARCQFKIWLEGLYRDLDCRICVSTPQFVTSEHYCV